MSDEKELTDKEAAALFNQATQALNDPVKLNEVMEKTAPEEEAPIEEEKPAEKLEDDQDKDTSKVEDDDKDKVLDDSDKKDDKKVEPDPSKKTDQPVEKEEPTKEPTELDKLKEQIEKLSKENHGLRSQVGRLPHVQRKIKEIDKKLEDLAKQEASPSSHPSSKIAPKVQELLKGISETDSDLADAIAKAIAAATEGVTAEARAKEKDTLTFLRQQELKSYQDAQAERLLSKYPEAPEVFASKYWADWKASQPAWVNRLADSDDADEVSEALERYATDMIAKYPELGKSVNKKEESTSIVKDDAAAEQAKRVEAERARKKETSVNITNPTAASKVTMPDDPVALFNKFVGDINKQRMG